MDTVGTFEFLISPDYEAGAKELTYTVKYWEATTGERVNPIKEESVTIIINDVLD